MSNEMRLSTDSGKLIVTFGQSVTYECDNRDTPSAFWWFDLWPEQMEAIRRFPIWEDSPLTFEQLEKMIEDFDENHICNICWTVSGGEAVPLWADMDIEQMEHHYLNN
ncbi:MAG: hypothetical protein WBB19_13080 [Desulforhopalus sp.]